MSTDSTICGIRQFLRLTSARAQNAPAVERFLLRTKSRYQAVFCLAQGPGFRVWPPPDGSFGFVPGGFAFDINSP